MFLAQVTSIQPQAATVAVTSPIRALHMQIILAVKEGFCTTVVGTICSTPILRPLLLIALSAVTHVSNGYHQHKQV
jgi:hypothetical protein